MKSAVLATLILTVPSSAFAGICSSLFPSVKEEKYDDAVFYPNEDHVRTRINVEATNAEFAKIEPDTRDLKFRDDKVEPGDFVYVGFTEPLDPFYPNYTKGFQGFILGTRFATNEISNNLNIFYYLYHPKTNKISSFPKHMIDFEQSQIIRKKYGRPIH